MGRTEELSDFQRGTVIGCHLCSKSIREISAMLELPRSTVSNVIVKWKRLGVTTALPRSGRPHKLSDRDLRMLERVVNDNRLSPVAKLTTEFQTVSGRNVCTRTVRRELHGMGFRGQSAPNKPKIIRRKSQPVVKTPVKKQKKAKENSVDEKPGNSTDGEMGNGHANALGTSPEPQPLIPGTSSEPQHLLPGTSSEPQHLLPGTSSEPQHLIPGTSPEPQPLIPGTSPVPQPLLPGTSPVPQPLLPGTSPVPQPLLPGTSLVLQPLLPGTSPVLQPLLSGTSPEPQTLLSGTPPEPQPLLPGTSPEPQHHLPGTSPEPQHLLPGTSPESHPLLPGTSSTPPEPVVQLPDGGESSQSPSNGAQS